ncbi:MFS family permease [Paraburkholderia terricola]|uniref:YbfB/YjiJ family MFS transporter n=1 Tax=Paraburkholderia terricola TaxID=169427 RepID=UPI00285454D1|nr:YbfB/YjiJ family MFS transporter [Paraburkholderia terricola]MDR6445808.1 MFS family permease [Paraburkholderia terricola]
MNDLASPTQHVSSERDAARRAALACMVTLAVVLGIGRFAFTPLLPLMLHGGASGQPQIDIQHGGWLASFNYAGYFVGAVTCAALRVEPARMVRAGLVATALLTLAMGVTNQFWVWAAVRFVAGAVSAWSFVFASQWGLRRLAELGAHGWGGVIYTGPGFGIAGTGLLVSAAGGYGATAGWIGFGLIAAVLSIVVWPVFGAAAGSSARSGSSAGSAGSANARAAASAGATDANQRVADRHATSQYVVGSSVAKSTLANPTSANLTAANRTAANPTAANPTAANRTSPNPTSSNPASSNPASPTPTPATPTPHRADAFWLILLYGVPGFGYIITATFLPVIARHALPGSSWPDLFWPMFGAALMVGALLAARLPVHWDNRTLLAGCYVLQALGIALGIVWPTAGGFSLGSILIGLPFTAITLFAMREARRLRGDDAAGLMGYATAAYGVGQIVGPLVAAPIAERTGSFSPALWLAAGALLLGAAGLIVVTRMSRGRGRMPACNCG